MNVCEERFVDEPPISPAACLAGRMLVGVGAGDIVAGPVSEQELEAFSAATGDAAAMLSTVDFGEGKNGVRDEAVALLAEGWIPPGVIDCIMRQTQGEGLAAAFCLQRCVNYSN